MAMPSSLVTQSTERRVTTEGIISSSTKAAPTAGSFKIDTKPESVSLIRKALLASAQAVKNKPKEVVSALVEMYGNNGTSALLDTKQLTRWTADYTEFKYAQDLAKRLSETEHKAVIPVAAHTVGLESPDFDYVDESNGIPLKEQLWVRYADAFIPKMMASVEVKTNTASNINAAKKGKTHFNAKYGESYLKNTPGIIGYVHFVQVGNLSLTPTQKSFLRKRVGFAGRGIKGEITLTSQDLGGMWDDVQKQIYASYYIDSYTVDMLSVAKVNAIIANTLKTMGLMSGVPTARIMSLNTKGIDPAVIINYIKQFAREGMLRSQKPIESRTKRAKTEYDVYEQIYNLVTMDIIKRGMREAPTKDYVVVLNKIFELIHSPFRFTVLNESFGIGRFEVEDEFIMQSRI